MSADAAPKFPGVGVVCHDAVLAARFIGRKFSLLAFCDILGGAIQAEHPSRFIRLRHANIVMPDNAPAGEDHARIKVKAFSGIQSVLEEQTSLVGILRKEGCQ